MRQIFSTALRASSRDHKRQLRKTGIWINEAIRWLIQRPCWQLLFCLFAQKGEDTGAFFDISLPVLTENAL